MLILLKGDVVSQSRLDLFVRCEIRFRACKCGVNSRVIIPTRIINGSRKISTWRTMLRCFKVLNQLLSLELFFTQINAVRAVSSPRLNAISVTDQFGVAISEIPFLLIRLLGPKLCPLLRGHIPELILLRLRPHASFFARGRRCTFISAYGS